MDRHDSAGHHCVDALANVAVRDLCQPMRTECVAEVDDLEPVEYLQPEVKMIGARLVCSCPDCPRTEPGTGPVGRRDVEWRPDDRDIGLPRVQLLELGQERPMTKRRETRVGQIELLGHSRRQFPLRPVVVLIAHERDSTSRRVLFLAIPEPEVTSLRTRRTSSALNPSRRPHQRRPPCPDRLRPGARNPCAPHLTRHPTLRAWQ